MNSMTGFSHLVKRDKFRRWEMKITSINSRFLDLIVEVYPHNPILEDMIRALVKNMIARGKITIHLTYSSINKASNTKISFSKELAQKVVKELRLVSKELKIDNDVKMSDLAKLNFLWNVEHESSSEISDKFVQAMTKEALTKLKLSRSREGQKLKKVILDYIKQIKINVQKLKNIQKVQKKDIHVKLKNKMEELNKKGFNNEGTNIEKETFHLISKSDVEEEVVRLFSHIVELERVVTKQKNVPIGKEIGFILQELNRECNTMSDKFVNIKGKHLSVNTKLLLEQIREQANNIE